MGERRARLVVALVLVLGWAILATPLGEPFTLAAFVSPALKLRHQAGLQPELDARVRLVVFDDSSLKHLDRVLTFAEWAEIAERLFALGYETVLHLGFPHQARDVGTPPARSGRGRFVIGSFPSRAEANKRATEVDDLPERLLLSAPPSYGDTTRRILAPAPLAMAFADRLGAMNAETDLTAPAGTRVGTDRVLPHISLLARHDLSWDTGGPSTAQGEFPLSRGDTLFLDFATPQSVTNASVRAIGFLDAHGGIARELPTTLRDKLAGGRVAVFVPEAFTGSRFIDSPFGKVPSYMGTVGLINAALRERPLVRPFDDRITGLWVLLPAFALASIRRTRRMLGGLLGGAAVMVGGSLALLLAQGILVPSAHLVLLLVLAAAARLAIDMIHGAIERLKMERDLEMGRMVQSVLLPTARDGRIGRWDYRIVFKPHGYMSGDWFQSYEGQDAEGRDVGVVAIGDCIGKGASAALCTVVIASVWRGWERRWRAGEAIDPLALAASLHDAIHDVFKGEQHTTLSLAVLKDGDLALMGVAAPTWITRRAADTACERLKRRPANPLGAAIVESQKLALVQHTPTLVAGDLYVGFTDGVMDGTYAERAFTEGLAALPDTGRVGEFFGNVEAIVKRAGEGSGLPDDYTLLMIRCRETLSPQASQEDPQGRYRRRVPGPS